jgi:hypothetical protein
VTLVLIVFILVFSGYYLSLKLDTIKHKQARKSPPASTEDRGKGARLERIVIYKDKKEHILTPKEARFHPVLDAAMETIKTANGGGRGGTGIRTVKDRAQQGETIVILYGEPGTLYDDKYIFLDDQPAKPVGGRDGGIYLLAEDENRIHEEWTVKTY